MTQARQGAAQGGMGSGRTGWGTRDAVRTRQLRGAAAHAAGRAAEASAEAALARDGWTVLARRLRTPSGEIDLIAERDEVLAFVEVKARPNLACAAVALGAR